MAPVPNSSLTAARERVKYSAAEREYSQLLRKCLDDVLTGRRRRLPLLRKYPTDPGRIGLIPTQRCLLSRAVDIFRLEQLTWDAVRFLMVDGAGGPVAECAGDDGGTIEIQTFATRYPLIVIERLDRYPCDGTEPDSITWTVCRIGQSRQDSAWLDALMQMARLVVGVAELLS